MAPVSVNGDLGYPIVVGDDVRDELAAFLQRRGPVKAVLCDANRHVVSIARDASASAGRPPVIPVALGEPRKRLATVERVLDALFAAGVERRDLVLGVGGGVASDVFGFACGTYMRGVEYAHVATTLVAMVDAAIGGKTAVNLKAGKNLAGSFADPAAVFCGVAALRTLPPRGVREGLSEVVKAGIIEGGEFFEALEELAAHPPARWPWAAIVEQAVRVKTAIVADDRQEAGFRETLNLGHTFAHAIERASNYTATHGEAVAIGLRAAGLLALRTGRFSEPEHLRVLTLLALLGLPLQTSLDADAMAAAMEGDKKKRAGQLRFVLPRAIGDVEYGVECDRRSVRAVLARLRASPEKFRARR